MGFMAILNIIVILFLGKIAIKCLNDYCKQKKSNKDPIFKELHIGMKSI